MAIVVKRKSAPKTMAMTDLHRRQKLPAAPTMKTLSGELAIKAANLLAYVPRQTAAEAELHNHLALQRLMEIGVKPFLEADVVKYKRVQAEATRKAVPRRRSRWGGGFYAVKVMWQETALGGHAGYKEAVPEYALATAVMIKEAIPEAQFFVDHLTVQHVRIPRPDPFLIVQIHTARFYIEVWDEPNFKAKRRV